MPGRTQVPSKIAHGVQYVEKNQFVGKKERQLGYQRENEVERRLVGTVLLLIFE
jgi:hypothetical protein